MNPRAYLRIQQRSGIRPIPSINVWGGKEWYFRLMVGRGRVILGVFEEERSKNHSYSRQVHTHNDALQLADVFIAAEILVWHRHQALFPRSGVTPTERHRNPMSSGIPHHVADALLRSYTNWLLWEEEE